MNTFYKNLQNKYSYNLIAILGYVLGFTLLLSYYIDMETTGLGFAYFFFWFLALYVSSIVYVIICIIEKFVNFRIKSTFLIESKMIQIIRLIGFLLYIGIWLYCTCSILYSLLFVKVTYPHP